MAAKPIRRRGVVIAVATTIGFLAFSTPALAGTGSVYFDSNFNVAAGQSFFSGTTPTGSFNDGVGVNVMSSLTAGNSNVALGQDALSDLTTGSSNVATGRAALTSSNGNDNVGTGTLALQPNSGNDNVGIGYDALAISGGDDNVAIGANAGNVVSGSNNVDIANVGKFGESKVIRIGTKGAQKRAFIAGVSGTTVRGSAQRVVVNSQGQLGTASAAKPAASKAATDRRFARMEAQIKRQQRQIGRLQREVQKKHG